MRAIRAGRDLPLGGPKQRSVLALLLLEAGRVVPSERLVDELWHGRPPTGAVKTLRSYVSRLRTLLESDAALISRGGGYVLELEQAHLDAARFELLVEQGQAALARGAARVAADRFREGLALWHGRALAEVLDIASLALESRRLEELRLTAVEGRIEAELGLGLHAQLVGELETLVAEHPLHERFWRQLVLALYRCERQADALATYRRARDLLAGELGLEPSEELRRLEQAVLRQDVPAVARHPGRHNLPAQLTTFVGRKHELAELERLLVEARLLTLTGVGGVGKTRLAIELAARLVESVPDGVWFVDLSGIADAALVPQQIAQVLGLQKSPNLPLVDLLCNHVRKNDLLLLLDNCEHLLPACAELVETLLRGAPTLRILATGREAVGVAGEVEYALMPLAVPSADADPKESSGVAAVRLFLERSSATHNVPATPTALATVARICRDLDGIPLAIELAAARTRTLSVDEIAAHLDDRFGFLKYWRRVAVPRHQTLEATMDWSYELLSEAEREVLRRLSVFAGGFTLQAAAAVCVGGDESNALDLVGRLVERSLVAADLREGETRYRLLETVRQYAAERLAEAGEVEETRRAHALAFLSLAEEAAPTGESLGRLALEQDNLRAALAWSLSTGEEIGPRLALACSRLWYVREQDEESLRWLERALEAHPERDGLRAELLGLLGTFVHEAGDVQRAGALLSEGLTLARSESNRTLEARLRVRYGNVRLHLGDLEWAEVLRECEQAAVVLESDGDLSGLADAWVSIGKARSWIGDDSDQDAFQRAGSYARQSGNRRAELVALEYLAMSFLDLRVPTDVSIEREEQLLVAAAGDRYTEEVIQGPLSWLYGFAGRFTEARQAIARCRALYAEIGAWLWWASHAQAAGAIELLAGDPVAAEDVLREAYAALHAMAEVSYRSTTALWLAESLYEQGRFEEAEQLTAEAETSAHPDDFIDQVHLRTLRAKLHARRGDVGAAKRLVEEARRITPAGNAQLLGEVLLTKAEVLRRAGQPRQAASELRVALRLYEERRVVPLADRARRLLEQLPADTLAQPR
jgi:predicted ATPase/DNA-binding SARP family transcriptional activator